MHHIGLRAKIFLLMALPITGLMIFTSIYLADRVAEIRGANQLKQLLLLGTHNSAVVHELQKERGATAGYLGSRGNGFADILRKQRLDTDGRLAKQEQFYLSNRSAFDEEGGLRVLTQARLALKDLNRIRDRVDTLDITLEEAIAYYTDINTRYLDSIAGLAFSQFRPEVSKDIEAYSSILQVKESAGLERAVLSNVFSQGSFIGRETLYLQLLELITLQRNLIHNFNLVASPEQGSERPTRAPAWH